VDKLKAVMTVEEFYFFQAKMYKLGWRWSDTEGFTSIPNKDTLIKSLLDMLEHTTSAPQQSHPTAAPQPSHTSPESASESSNYEISDYVR
jgi:hypothetical protein